MPLCIPTGSELGVSAISSLAFVAVHVLDSDRLALAFYCFHLTFPSDAWSTFSYDYLPDICLEISSFGSFSHFKSLGS